MTMFKTLCLCVCCRSGVGSLFPSTHMVIEGSCGVQVCPSNILALEFEIVIRLSSKCLHLLVHLGRIFHVCVDSGFGLAQL